VTSGAYQHWMEQNYSARGEAKSTGVAAEARR
jgi:hypothetical protein